MPEESRESLEAVPIEAVPVEPLPGATELLEEMPRGVRHMALGLSVVTLLVGGCFLAFASVDLTARGQVVAGEALLLSRHAVCAPQVKRLVADGETVAIDTAIAQVETERAGLMADQVAAGWRRLEAEQALGIRVEAAWRAFADDLAGPTARPPEASLETPEEVERAGDRAQDAALEFRQAMSRALELESVEAAMGARIEALESSGSDEHRLEALRLRIAATREAAKVSRDLEAGEQRRARAIRDLVRAFGAFLKRRQEIAARLDSSRRCEQSLRGQVEDSIIRAGAAGEISSVDWTDEGPASRLSWQVIAVELPRHLEVELSQPVAAKPKLGDPALLTSLRLERPLRAEVVAVTGDSLRIMLLEPLRFEALEAGDLEVTVRVARRPLWRLLLGPASEL